MTPTLLSILALALLALALLLAAVALLRQQADRSASTRVIQRALSAGQTDATGAGDDALAFLRDGQLPTHWLNSRLGRLLVADEDRKLIAQCGFPSTRAQLLLLVSRAVLAVVLPLLANAFFGAQGSARNAYIVTGIGFAVGFMLPKWVISYLAAKRRARVARELPLFVDLLGLLQSVGLSLDQSLQVIASDFLHVLPVIGSEVAAANRQYNQGRTREHAFQRIAHLHDNPNLADFVSLVVQVDRHGGAIQEPIRQFSERLRVQRKAEMKALIGKITVKMTVVMVATLLPALIIITAGPGFIAIVRSVANMGGS